jgi:hypothetical protein
VRRDQNVSQMAEEVLTRQAKVLAHQRGHSLENARRAVLDTEAGEQLRELANGEHRHEKAQAWQASVFWERAEERLMHQIGSETLSRFAAEHRPTRSSLATYRVVGKQGGASTLQRACGVEGRGKGAPRA